jgi:beta-glucosidase-like glycosyl hydrolase
MEFYPKKMFEEGLASVMVAHLNVPSLESKPNYPSFFYNVVTNVLQKNWAFRSYFTDALNMKAVSKFSTPADRFTRFSGGERCFIISGRCL